MCGVKSATSSRKSMAAFSKSYLLLYNSVQAAGWSYFLFQTVKFLLQNRTVIGLWQQCGTSVLIFQSLAGLEVAHCVLGLVPANAVVTFIQILSRVLQVWGIMLPVEKVQESSSLAVTFLAWGITEVVRYSFYCLNILEVPSKALAWCRYSFFFVLYPAGVFGEVCNILQALDTIQKRQLFSLTLPNPFNISFSYYYANILILVSYIPIFPQLFKHMLRQRRKVLSKVSK